MGPRRAAAEALLADRDQTRNGGGEAVSIISSTEESQELDALLQLSEDDGSVDEGQDFLFKRKGRAVERSKWVIGSTKPCWLHLFRRSGSRKKERESEGKDSTGFAARNSGVDYLRASSLVISALAWEAPRKCRLSLLAVLAVAAEEDSGDITFECITNDVPVVNPSEERIERLKKLVACKNLFARQLPKMPKEYIAKLVFDRRHTTYTMWKGASLIGAVCFRCYFKYGLLEIAFLAVTSDEQVKGYGTRLMNRLKEFIKQCNPHIETASPEFRPITHFITYADNAAVGYFAKQGFTKHVKIPKYVWSGMIKSYEGAHMMSVELALDVNYLGVADMLSDTRRKVWREALEERPPVEMPALSESAGRIPDPLPLAQVPGIGHSNFVAHQSTPVKSAGESLSADGDVSSSSTESLQSRLLSLTDACFQHKSSWPFRMPVAVKDAPDYYMIIKHASDLSTIKKKLQGHQITSIREYRREMMWIFDNCRFYNGDDGNIYVKCARELEKFAFTRLKQIEADFGGDDDEIMDDGS
ncbi:hypothetical protein FOZ61_010525, partial [Perkinsus olseni]